MTVFEKIQQEIKSAMMAKDVVRRDCLRMVVSEVKNQTINANPPREIDDDICLKVLRKSAKTHEDSIAQFKSAGRNDLLEKEQKELDVISAFLPKMLSEDETRKFVEEKVSTGGIEPVKKNMGIFMKSLSTVEGLDKRIASKILSQILK